MSSCTVKNLAAPGVEQTATAIQTAAVAGATAAAAAPASAATAAAGAVAAATNAGVAVASCSSHSVASADATTTTTMSPSPSSSWSKRKRYSSGPDDGHDASYTHPSVPKHGRHGGASVPPPPQQPQQQQYQQQQQPHRAAVRPWKNVYIKLADESPLVSGAETDADSVYGSFHGLETDICRDTSDTDSYSTEEFATLDVLEYEIPSDSSTSEELYSHDSSSGTDDFVVTAAQLARALFACQKSATGSGGTAAIELSMADNGRGGGDDDAAASVAKDGGNIVLDEDSRAQTSTEFEVFADTEESDGPTDPELGRADYWTCVKCKNRQNNPMYRYCERCYQIRKTHFPPRPKLQKTRSAVAALGGGGGGGGPVDTFQQWRNRYHRRRLNGIIGARRGTSNGDDDENYETDEMSSDDDAPDGREQRSRRRRRRTHSGQRPAHSNSSPAAVTVSQALPERLSSRPPPAKRRRSNDSDASSNADMFRARSRIESDVNTQQSIAPAAAATSASTSAPAASVDAASGSRCTPTHLRLHTSTRDSGFQSSSASATDQTPDSERDVLAVGTTTTTTTTTTTQATTNSQETYCSDAEQPHDDDDCAAVPVTASTSTLSTGSSLDLAITARSTSSCSLLQHFDSQETASQEDDCDATATTDATLNATVLAATTPQAACSSPVAGTSSYPGGGRQLDVGAHVGGTAASVSATLSAAEAADAANGMCMMCLSQPKNGVFVHSRFLHLCCCYRCAVKVWNKQKRCPICNCKVKNVMKLFVH